MQHFETSDPKVMMDCKRAQFSGRVAALPSSGGAIASGLVHSVVQSPKSEIGAWIIAFFRKIYRHGFQ